MLNNEIVLFFSDNEKILYCPTKKDHLMCCLSSILQKDKVPNTPKTEAVIIQTCSYLQKIGAQKSVPIFQTMVIALWVKDAHSHMTST